MIYFCNGCNEISFRPACGKCGDVENKIDTIPLNPAYLQEFQYESKGFISNLIGKKKELKKLKESLEQVLNKYQELKNPYFVNFSYIFSHSTTEEPGSLKLLSPYINGSYTELELFYKILVRKGFVELKEQPQLLKKLLMSTIFEAYYNGFSQQIKRHIGDSLNETLRSWIEESGVSFRSEICLFLYYLWEKDIKYKEINYNNTAKEDASISLMNRNSILEICKICESIYYDNLVNRLDVKITNFDIANFYTIHRIDAMDGFEFESFLIELFRTIGYDVQDTKKTGDQGADLFVEKFGVKTVIQAKNYASNVGNSAIQQVISAKQFYSCDRAMVITNSYYTKSAIELANSANVQLKNRNDLNELLDEYNYQIIEAYSGPDG